MSTANGCLSQKARQELRAELNSINNRLLFDIPKAELHVHIEGTMTPALRWKLAQRNNLEVRLGWNSNQFASLEELEEAHLHVISSAQLKNFTDEELKRNPPVTFFEAYFSGFDVLRSKQDFYDLAFDYFKRAAAMNVRYCEPFFDPQGHTRRGVSWGDMMGGFREAQEKARQELNVHSAWVMCFLRDSSPEAAMEHYRASLAYKDMVVGIGLDSNEYKRPPTLFNDVFALARQDGFKITSHCDVGQEDTHEHLRQVATTIAGTGADRIDHGINAAEKPELIEAIVQRGIGLTVCPWAYLRRETYDSIGERIRVLVDSGVTICIASDGPPNMDNAWVTHNLLLTQKMCGFNDEEMIRLVRNSITMSWAESHIKQHILQEIDAMVQDREGIT